MKQLVLLTIMVVVLALTWAMTSPRYQLAGGMNGFAFKIDTWTGKTWSCINGQKCHEVLDVAGETK